MHITLIIADVRSAHNVGSLLRTCDGLGIDEVYMTGITPYPTGHPDDERLPHISQKVTKDIHKTALGAESTVLWHYRPNVTEVIASLKHEGCTVYALEQTPTSIQLEAVVVPEKLALILGNEVDGVPASVVARCDGSIEIPMSGAKESFNVSVAGAIALYQLKNNSTKVD